MIKSRFLLATFVGIFVYTLVSFIAGRNGVICYTQLNEQKKEISLQVANIQNINNELIKEFSALEKDRDVIAAYARAAVKMQKEGMSGCKTVFDIAPAYLTYLSGDEIRAHLL